jgi:hypothetical protein
LQQQNITEQQNIASLIQQLIGEIRQLQSKRSTTPPPSDPPISILVSTPYQPPHTRMHNGSRSHTLHSTYQDPLRREDECVSTTLLNVGSLLAQNYLNWMKLIFLTDLNIAITFSYFTYSRFLQSSNNNSSIDR